MNSKIVTIIIIISLLSITWLNVHPHYKKDFFNNSENQTLEIVNEYEDGSGIEPNNPTSGTRALQSTPKIIENNGHGGSWLDSFTDDSKIDWGSSNYVKTLNGDLTLTGYPDQPFKVDNSTVALWHMDENSGVNVIDSSDYKNNGTFNETATRTSGKFNRGLYFSGKTSMYVADGVIVPNSDSLNLTENFTIEAWIKTSSTDFRLVIVDKYRISGGIYYGYRFWLYNGKLRLSVNSALNGTIDVTGKTDLRDGRWHYVAAVLNGSNIKVFVDHILENDKPWSHPPENYNRELTIGKYIINGINNYAFVGYIDEVRISNNARNFDLMANLTSKPINLPAKSHWCSLLFNKTQVVNTSIKITILNASNNQPIPSTPEYLVNGEYDISSIDPVKYPSIRLQAELVGRMGLHSPQLYFWGVSWNTTDAWRDTFLGGVKCSMENLTYGDGEIWLNTSRTKFIKYKNNPILTKGSGSSWDRSSIGNPCVIYNGSMYIMYYSGHKGTPTIQELGMATSKDGLTWTKYSGNPTLLKGGVNDFDGYLLGAMDVIYDGNTYQMWYSGADGNKADWQTGYATSDDGFSWQKHTGNPVINLGTSTSWEGHYAFCPRVHYDGLRYKMWYTGLGQMSISKQKAPYQIGYATSWDGALWRKFDDNPIIEHPYGWYIGLAGLDVIYENGQYLGWHNYAPGSSKVSINFTTSVDGITWVNYSNNPVLKNGSSSDWDYDSVGAANVIKINKQYFMYYTAAASTPGSSAIGIARSAFDKQASLSSEPINLLAPDKHEFLIINKTEPLKTYINVTILNSSNSQPIPGYVNLRGKYINISGINRTQHPVIVLKATIDSNAEDTPILYDWSIGLNTAPRIDKITSDTSVKRTYSTLIRIDLLDGEEQENDLTLTVEYKAPSDTNWQTTYLNSFRFADDHWETRFGPNSTAELGNYTFRFLCYDSTGKSDINVNRHNITVLNNIPSIYSYPTNAEVNRTDTLKINIGALDRDALKKDLTVTMRYKSPMDTLWQTGYLSSIVFDGNIWSANFTPPKNAYFGSYIFNATCSDSIDGTFINFNILVKNNYPFIKIVKTTPTNYLVNRTRTLKLMINVSDVENLTSGLNVTMKYKSPVDVTWQSAYLSGLTYNTTTTDWEVNFAPPIKAELGSYTFNVTTEDNDSGMVIKNLNIQVANSLPRIWSIKTNSTQFQINRTRSIKIIINVTDVENSSSQLKAAIKYKSPMDANWNTAYLSNLIHNNGNWEIDFSPLDTADLGWYTFDISFEDYDVGIGSDNFQFMVLNNMPNIFDIILSQTRVNRTFSVDIEIDSFDVEVNAEDLDIDIKYQTPLDTVWRAQYISEINYQNSKWHATFTPTKTADLGLYNFLITCNDNDCDVVDSFFIEVLNNDPIIKSITRSGMQINRTDIMEIFIDVSDVERSANDLDIFIKYRSPTDSVWKTDLISNIRYTNSVWKADFTPPKTAPFGKYIFNITCNDSDSEVYSQLEVEVLNNIPMAPTVVIVPVNPFTTDDLEVMIANVSDVETAVDNIEHIYRWYKNDIYMPEFDDLTIISNTETSKGEKWSCIVYSFDGVDFSLGGGDEKTILNSPPEIMNEFTDLIMFEDGPVILQNKFTEIFSDPDGDDLVYSHSGQKNIQIEIFQDNGTLKLIPAENWFGTEVVTFYASDTLSTPDEVTVKIEVKPANDLPVIVQVGEAQIQDSDQMLTFTVQQDMKLKLEILVEDVDGGEAEKMISYKINISERSNLYFQQNELIFNPKNEEVGQHYLTILATDNNETPIQFVSQEIRIRVTDKNDPPTIRITSPENDQEFSENDDISFVCVGNDIDLLIPKSPEKLNYKWFSNKSEFGVLGTERELFNISTLPPGFYTITAEVTDSGGAKSHEKIRIRVNKAKTPVNTTNGHDDISDSKEAEANIVLLAVLVLVIIISLIFGIFLFHNYNSKKKGKTPPPTPHQDQPPQLLRSQQQMPQTTYIPPQQSQQQILRSTYVQPQVLPQQHWPTTQTREPKYPRQY